MGVERRGGRVISWGRCGLGVALLLYASIASAQGRWRLEEEVRIGSLDEGPASFSRVHDIGVTPNGNIFVLDAATQQLQLFDASGRFLRTVARKGAGPGEIRRANGLVVMPNGLVWVNDPANGRFTVFSADGKFERQHRVSITGFAYRWDAWVDPTGLVHDRIWLEGPGGVSRQAHRRIAPDGSVRDTVPETSCPSASRPPPPIYRVSNGQGEIVLQVPFLPTRLRAIDPRGHAWCAMSDRYEITRVRSPDGTPVAVARGSASALRVSRAERDSVVEALRSMLAPFGGIGRVDLSLIPSVKPVIVALDVDDRGRLWVRRESADPVRTEFDVFDANGRAVASVSAPFRIPPDGRVQVKGDVMYAVAVDGDDVPYVIRSRVHTR